MQTTLLRSSSCHQNRHLVAHAHQQSCPAPALGRPIVRQQHPWQLHQEAVGALVSNMSTTSCSSKRGPSSCPSHVSDVLVQYWDMA